MRRGAALFLLPALLLLSGCHGIGDKAASLSVIYGVAAVLSLLLLIGCGIASQKKNPWLLLLFSSVLVVNIGYFALSVSDNLEEALLANRLSYLGSVFLPLSVCMIIRKVTGLYWKKWVPGFLLVLGAVMFLIAASPGYLDIYYQDVTFEKINGVTVLNKVYGPLHGLYMLYLFGYFAIMVASIVYATLKHKVKSLAYAVILAIAVFVNIGVWLLEQLVSIDFEILSVSYIISESFLLGLHLFIEETERQKAKLLQQSRHNTSVPEEPVEPNLVSLGRPERFAEGLTELTPKERALFDCYAAGMTELQIMEQLNIKESTLKFYNMNLCGKLGVSSPKQLRLLQGTKNG